MSESFYIFRILFWTFTFLFRKYLFWSKSEGPTLIALTIQDYRCPKAKNSIGTPRPIYDAAFSASRLRCSNLAKYIRRTKKSKLTSRPAISRRFMTQTVLCCEWSYLSGRGPGNLLLPLLLPSCSTPWLWPDRYHYSVGVKPLPVG